MSNAQHTAEFFRDQYGHVYAWRDTADGKVSEVIIDARHSKATNEEKSLIAAAPELLEALIVLRERHQIDDPHHAHLCQFCQRADAAIAKATGGAQ